MATDFNSVTLIGRLTADPVSKYLPSGSAVVEFSIANNYYVSSKNTTEVNYFDVVAFGKIAETVSKYLTKGKQVAIMGTLRQERWQDKDTNAARSKVRIIMQSMQMLGTSGNAAAGMDTAYSPSASSGSVDLGSFEDDDEVPF
ncbi:single-stranded DNA-binding protein [Brachyspira hyodysenteriae]|uniref:Single-stranded DNA-binding protein n=2 Tax=Brachyspira hyodysenteriae TaxID=159 RepID=A0A3B6V913_BRAHW|nr:single-stranded DNA-binding protein [Brachyspira hyodysenteriae]ACN83515.1 single-stranded DNA-binding protein [Brachyspira hyodysenteriae WA1]ANN64352.1 single-stranded DNA-binding protein [Brachyspira hyodysenteriae ATCC 27164]AUJ49251.1 single-stranded DNA-binding protein [Brachyspira hyodysenteriae]KLI14240.1 single-stranded DNA-binding protein [Brachyspira hyodysenteriae]KLI17046.1 single-stranded DNA-binding protein [Brachyspira hyodysenteriae]